MRLSSLYVAPPFATVDDISTPLEFNNYVLTNALVVLSTLASDQDA